MSRGCYEETAPVERRLDCFICDCYCADAAAVRTAKACVAGLYSGRPALLHVEYKEPIASVIHMGLTTSTVNAYVASNGETPTAGVVRISFTISVSIRPRLDLCAMHRVQINICRSQLILQSILEIFLLRPRPLVGA